MSENSNFNQNPAQDYTVFGGWLLVWYWGLIIGGIIILLSMVLPALISIGLSFWIGAVYFVGVLVSILSVCVAAVLNIKVALQLKARNPRFFDTLVLSMLIALVGNIVSSILMIRGIYGLGSFIGSLIGSIIGVAVGLGLCIMYFSKSVRVKTYFSGRPLQNSRYWKWIQRLPDFIISSDQQA